MSQGLTRESGVLVTGGTGSFGRAFVKEVLRRFPDIRRLVIFSRDELKQFEMAQEFPDKQKGSANYQKSRAKVSRLHLRIKRQRKDFHYKEAYQL
ncbi:polysaccharide biosynthesis protein [Thermosynechococcus sp. FA-CM-4201]